MSAVARTSMTYADYLTAERIAQVKHEYLRGQVWAMAGGTVEHGRLAMAVGSALSGALRGKPCVVLSSDVRVRIEATDRTTYPDVTVVCGPRAVAADDPDAIVNPVVLVEVLSDSTEADDRGEKFAHYRRLASLREYVLVSQRERRIEVFRREGDHWSLEPWVLTRPPTRGIATGSKTIDRREIARDPAACGRLSSSRGVLRLFDVHLP